MHRGRFAFLLSVAVVSSALAGDKPVGRPLPKGGYTVDSASVERFGPAYKYPQAGWIVLHIEGEPYERGFQHGKLMAGEIVEYLEALGPLYNSKDAAAGYDQLRTTVNALFLRRYDPEYLEEMKGIADGVTSAGGKFRGRSVDLLDVATINSEIEVAFLDGGLEAWKTGLEGREFKEPVHATPAPKPKDRCSAFIATGPATADGKIVFGHITMWNLNQSGYYNVWLDVKPSKGRRCGMQTYPGGLMSGMDYYLNDAGIMLAETTIGQTPFDPTGMSLVSRCRQAIQYSETVDDVVRFLSQKNNGLYTNEWLIGDTKTNEIAMFEMGTNAQKLWRSSKKEWLPGAEGLYWGCNNEKDLAVRLDCHPDLTERPKNLTFRPSDRDVTWLELYGEFKGKVGPEFARRAFQTPPLAAAGSLDAKFTTSDLAKEMKSYAIFGALNADVREPSARQLDRLASTRRLVGNDWSLIDVRPPSTASHPAADLGPKWSRERTRVNGDDSKPAWKGTILPKADADVWLAGAFAEYERVASFAKSLPTGADGDAALERRLFAPRSKLFAARKRFGGGDIPPGMYTLDYTRNEPYDMAVQKGVLFLDHLRRTIGTDKFDEALTAFGKKHAGQKVSTEDFRLALEGVAKKSLEAEFTRWLSQPGLPTGANALAWSVDSFQAEPKRTIIVYGTVAEDGGNRTAAKRLAEQLKWGWYNHDVPIHSDAEVADADLRSNHVLLVGRPSTNAIAAKWAASLPVKFGPASFAFDDKHYANRLTGVAAVAGNPLNDRYTTVIYAGLSGEATIEFVESAGPQRHSRSGEVILREADRNPVWLLAPRNGKAPAGSVTKAGG